MDHLDVFGTAIADMNGADLILQKCDLHSATATTFDVPTGAKLTGNSFAFTYCLNSAVTTKASTGNFTNYFLP